MVTQRPKVENNFTLHVLLAFTIQHYAEKLRSEAKERTIADFEVADEELALQSSAKKISSNDNILMVVSNCTKCCYQCCYRSMFS